LGLAPGPTEHYRVFEEIYSAGIGTRKADMVHEETYERVAKAEEGKPQTTRICDPHLIRLLELEAGRRGQKSLSSAAEQLLTERFMQIECLTDRGFMDVYGHKIKERKLMQKEVEKNLAAAVAVKTKDLQAEVDTLRADNAKIAWELDEWKAGRRQRVSRLPVRREPVKSQRELEFDAEQERLALEEANRSLRDAERAGEVEA
jgi:hypothetical protein